MPRTFLLVQCLLVQCLLPLGVLAAASPASAQNDVASDSVLYWSSVDRVLAGDTAIDFLSLRLASMRLKPVGPIKVSEALARMRAAPSDEAARAVADSAMRYSITWIPAHNAVADTFAARGDTTRERIHRTASRLLLASMDEELNQPGSLGISVRSVAEEYVYMRAKGIERGSQGVGRCGDRMCDTLTGRDLKTNEQRTVTFVLTWWRSPG